MDPDEGAVLLDGIDVREIAQASLRRSVVLVPQEGFLFDDTLAANLRYGRLDATEADILASADELGLGRLAGRAAAGPRHPGRPARRVPVGGRAAAGRAAARPSRRPRPAGPRRGDQRGRPGAGDADRPGARAPDARTARRSRSRTASPPRRTPTRSSSSTGAGSSSAARTRELVPQDGVYAGLHASWVAQHG